MTPVLIIADWRLVFLFLTSSLYIYIIDAVLCEQNKIQVADILDEMFGHPLKRARKGKVTDSVKHYKAFI